MLFTNLVEGVGQACYMLGEAGTVEGTEQPQVEVDHIVELPGQLERRVVEALALPLQTTSIQNWLFH